MKPYNEFDNTLPFKVVFTHSQSDLVKEVYAPSEEEAISIVKDSDYYPLEFPSYGAYFCAQIYFEDEFVAEYAGGIDEMIKQ